ncbi:hypothetical protein STENM327S_04822 [Streptomyces tendae]
MSTVAFLNIGMHGHVDPTLPVVSELVKRGHKVTYHIWPSFRAAIENTGAEVRLYSGGAPPLPDPVTPLTLLGPSPAPRYGCCRPSSPNCATSAPT